VGAKNQVKKQIGLDEDSQKFWTEEVAEHIAESFKKFRSELINFQCSEEARASDDFSDTPYRLAVIQLVNNIQLENFTLVSGKREFKFDVHDVGSGIVWLKDVKEAA
jgi:hypothetical protein